MEWIKGYFGQCFYKKCYNKRKKEAMYVNNVIDFIAKKKEREDRKRAQDLERYGSC